MKSASTGRKENRPRRESARNESELLFEDYLKGHAAEFAYELPVPGRAKRPDYHITWKGTEFIAEVKELRARRPRPNGAANYDPYGHIRRAMEKACPQFKEHRDKPCVLVLRNVDDWEFRDWPYVLFGAMLGDLGTQMPFDAERGQLLIDQAHNTFLDGGKIVKRRHGVIENRTISAVAIMADFEIPNPLYEVEYRRRRERRRRELGRELSIEDVVDVAADLHLRDKVRRTLGDTLQLKIFENPVARLPLSRDVLDGTYDERHAINRHTGKIERVFAGEGVIEAERVTGQSLDLPRKLDRFLEAVVEQFDPERVILFGSHAYGCPDADSDVDLLVIFPGDGNAADRSLEIRKRLNPDFALDLLTRSAGEVDRRIELGDAFMKEILEEGRALYARERSA